MTRVLFRSVPRTSLRLLTTAAAIALLAATPAPLAAAEPVLLEGIAAQVGDEIILESEVSEQLAVARMQFAIADSNLAQAREEILRRLIDEKIIIQEARSEGITAGAEEVENAVDQYVEGIRKSLGSEEALERELAREGLSYEDLLERYRGEARQEILYTRLVQREIYSQIAVTEEEVEQYYKEHRSELPERVEQVRLSHVFIGFRPSDDAIESAQQKLDRVRERLAAGESFGDIARAMSDDPGTRDAGGDLGWVERGELDATIEEVAFGLEVGEVSEPFQTPHGVEVVRVSEKDPDKDRVRIQHILILLRATPGDLERARERAAKVLGLARSGVDFAALAEEYSNDADSAARGGDIGMFQVPDLVPFVAAAVDGLGVGEVSDIVRSDQGLHIFKVTERTAAGNYTLAEVRDQLRTSMAEERAAALTEEWLTDLRQEYFIRRADAPISSLGAPPSRGPAFPGTGVVTRVRSAAADTAGSGGAQEDGQ